MIFRLKGTARLSQVIPVITMSHLQYYAYEVQGVLKRQRFRYEKPFALDTGLNALGNV